MSKSVERERKASGEREPRRTGGYRGSTVELEELGKDVDALTENVGKMAKVQLEYQKKTSGKFDEIDDRLDGIDTKLGEILRVTGGLQRQSNKLNTAAISTTRRLDEADSTRDARMRKIFEELMAEAGVKPSADEPEPVAKATEPEKPEQLHAVRPGSIFTGKAYVFFIHDKDGNVIWDWPFYQPSAAKAYDWNYELVPSWVENGEFVRMLEPAEAARMRR